MDMALLQSFLIPTIVVLALITGFILKHLISDETFENKYIPVVVTLEGIVVSVILALTGGEPITTELVLTAIVAGGVSGASSSGFVDAFDAFISKPKFVEKEGE